MASEPKATRSELLSDVAIEQFFLSLMFGRGDMDIRLRELGIARHDLEELLYDDEIGAALDTRRESVIATPWHLEPGDDENAIFVYDQLKPLIDQILRCAWSAVPFGYSVGELVFMPSEDGRLVLNTVTEKPIEWFIPEVDGTLRYRHPMEGIQYVDLKRKFMLTVRDQTYRRPNGWCLLSSLYSSWFYRKHGWRFWMQFLERVGIPFLLGETTGDTEVMATELRKMAQGGTMAVASGDKVALLASQMSGDHFQSFDQAVSKRIQKLILGQTLTSDSQGVGSQALGNVHYAVMEDRRNADIRMVSKSVQMVVDAIWLVNELEGKAPEFVMEDDLGIQAERADRDAKLVNAGIVKLKEDYILRAYDYEKDEIEIPESQPIPPGLDPNNPSKVDPTKDQNMPQLGGTKKPSFSSAKFFPFSAHRFTSEQQAIESLVSAGVSAGSQPIDPALIARAVRAAKSPEDLDDRLAVLLAGMQDTDFVREQARALFAADILGWVHSGT